MKTLNRIAFGVLGAVVVSSSACGDSSFGNANGDVDGGGDGDSLFEGGGLADSGMLDTGTPDDAMNLADVPCSPEMADTSIGLFVDLTSTTPPASCGSPAGPCSTIGAALAALATTSKTTLYVAIGTYNESITLISGVTIKGGWKNTGGTFARACSANPASGVVIQGTSNITVTAQGLTSAATLETLTITSKPVAAASESLYGIFATGAATAVTLTNVIINIAAGGAGSPGAVGTTTALVPGAVCTPAGTGTAGAAAGVATAASVSGYSVSGHAAGAGNTGPSGNPGSNGVQNSPGITCEAGGTSCDSMPCSVAGGPMVCPPAGGIGCAGNAGSGGGGGGGAGSSIGIFAWDAHVTATATSVTSGNGGIGGAGGAGGPIGAGTTGPAGSRFVVTDCGAPNSACPVTHHLINGSIGSTGGSGGAGATGSGGPGGDSYAVYKGGGAVFTPTMTTLVAGTAGGAGAGSPAGPAGTSAMSN